MCESCPSRHGGRASPAAAGEPLPAPPSWGSQGAGCGTRGWDRSAVGARYSAAALHVSPPECGGPGGAGRAARSRRRMVLRSARSTGAAAGSRDRRERAGREYRERAGRCAGRRAHRCAGARTHAPAATAGQGTRASAAAHTHLPGPAGRSSGGRPTPTLPALTGAAAPRPLRPRRSRRRRAPARPGPRPRSARRARIGGGAGRAEPAVYMKGRCAESPAVSCPLRSSVLRPPLLRPPPPQAAFAALPRRAGAAGAGAPTRTFRGRSARRGL